MRNKIENEIKKLDNLFNKIDQVEDIELQGQWARYLCVLVSGFIENSCKFIISEYSTRQSPPKINEFIIKNVNRQTNFNSTNIISFFSTFSKEWGETLENFIVEDKKESIDTILNNRHQIVHGKNAGVSFVIVKRCFENIKETV